MSLPPMFVMFFLYRFMQNVVGLSLRLVMSEIGRLLCVFALEGGGCVLVYEHDWCGDCWYSMMGNCWLYWCSTTSSVYQLLLGLRLDAAKKINDPKLLQLSLLFSASCCCCVGNPCHFGLLYGRGEHIYLTGCLKGDYWFVNFNISITSDRMFFLLSMAKSL